MIPVLYQVLPQEFQGFTVYDVNNDYMIVINSRMSETCMKKFYEGEEKKIRDGHYLQEVVRSIYKKQLIM